MQIAIFIFIYTVTKLGLYPTVREMKAVLADLENQVTTETEKLVPLRKRWQLLAIILCIILTIIFILRIWNDFS